MSARTVLVSTQEDRSLAGTLARFSRLTLTHVDSGKVVDMTQLYHSKRSVLFFIGSIARPASIEALQRLHTYMDRFREQAILVAVICISPVEEVLAAKQTHGWTDMNILSETAGKTYAAFPDFQYQDSRPFSCCRFLCCCETLPGYNAWLKGRRPAHESRLDSSIIVGGVLVVGPAAGSQGYHILYSAAKSTEVDHIDLDKLMAAYRAGEDSPRTTSRRASKALHSKTMDLQRESLSRKHLEHVPDAIGN